MIESALHVVKVDALAVLQLIDQIKKIIGIDRILIRRMIL